MVNHDRFIFERLVEQNQRYCARHGYSFFFVTDRMESAPGLPPAVARSRLFRAFIVANWNASRQTAQDREAPPSYTGSRRAWT